MTDSNDVALRDLQEALESQQPDGQRLHAVTLRVTHLDIFTKAANMSDIKETIYYKELRAGDLVQDGDQFRDVDGQWKPYTFLAHMGGKVEFGETARRPIRTTHQTAYEEVPGGRTLQQAIEQPQRERWAYEELQPGDVIEAGDQWQNSDGRWHALVLIPGASAQVRDDIRARRPHNITRLETERDKTRAEVTQLRAERQEWIDQCNADSVRAARLSEQLCAAEVAVKSAQRARDELQLQVDELRAGLMGVVSAEHVHSMLEDMLDQTEWVGQCLDSSTYEQMSCIQRTISVIAQRVNDMGKEADGANT